MAQLSDRAKKYRLHTDLHYQTSLKGYYLEEQYLSIRSSGKVTVKRGFCSDGCSPKWSLGWLGLVGVPDGPFNVRTGLPVTGRAFFLHDALLEHLYGFRTISRAQIHEEFCREIMKTDFALRKLYCWAVRKFGPKD